MSIQKILDFNIGSLTLGKILLALVVAVACILAARLLFRLFDRLLQKSRIDKTLQGFIKGTSHAVVYFIMVVVVADCLDISIVSLVAVFSVAGLAVSMAAESSLSNLAGGIILLALKPFQVGDYVEAGSDSGTVQEIGLFYTRLLTADGKTVYIPNGDIASSHIVNYSREKQRRVEIKVTASYDSPVERVKEAVREAMAGVDGIAAQPEPFVNVSEYKDSSIEYTLRVWTEPDKYWDVYYALMEKLKESFDRHQVEMTYNHLNVHMVADK